MCSTLSAVGRHLHSLILSLALVGVGATTALAQVEGGEGIDAPPGAEGTDPPPGSPPQAAETDPPEDGEDADAPTEGEGAATEGESVATESEGGEGATVDGEGEGTADPDAAGGEGDGDLPPPAGAEGQAPTAGPLQVIVVDAAPHGVAPVVGRHVTERIRITAQEMGYTVVAPAATVQAAQRMQMPYPPSPADLWRVTYVSQSQRGAFAKVWAHGGRYVFEITIASLDGSGPFFARGTSGAEDLHEVVERLTREALPAPATFDAEAAERYAQPQQGEPPTREQAVAAQWTPPEPVDRVEVSQRRVSRRPNRRFDVALQTEAAFGTSSDFFYNHLVGLRLGFRITHNLHIGLYGAYANLRGRDSRESNLLPMLQLTQRIRLSSRSDLTVPIRASVGYLPFNGPVLRISAGLNIPVSERVEIGADILSPTFWFLGSQVEISLNVGLEVIFRL